MRKLRKRVEDVEKGEWVLHPEHGWCEVIGTTIEDDLHPDVLVWCNDVGGSTRIVGHAPGTVIEVRTEHPHDRALDELETCPVCAPLDTDVHCMWCKGKRLLDPHASQGLGQVLDALGVEWTE